MFNKKYIWALLITAATLCCLFVVGCTGSTDTEPAEDGFSNTLFVPTDESTGTITLTAKSTSIGVSQTTPFTVAVRDVSGNPVPNLRVACDTEIGLAIIEPNTGIEMTDQWGNMSGIVGCDAPGSFQMACRLPIGANKRKFLGIKCTGDAPQGFTGFPNAAGGGLYGGVGMADDGDGEPGGTGTDGFVITQIDFVNILGESTTSMDTRVTWCETDDEGNVTCESFGDAFISVAVENNTNQDVHLKRYRFSIDNADGAGNTFTSKYINLDGTTVDANGGTATHQALFLDAVGHSFTSSDDDGDVCTGGARFPDATAAIPLSLGFRNVTVRLEAENDFGEDFTRSRKAAASFDNYDLCSSE